MALPLQLNAQPSASELLSEATAILDLQRAPGSQYASARRMLTQARDLDPQNPEVIVQLARSELKVNSLSRESLQTAAQLVRQATEIDATHGNAWAYWGFILIQQKNHDLALEYLHRAKELRATSEWLDHHIARAMEQRQPEEAMRRYDLLGADPNRPVAIRVFSLARMATYFDESKQTDLGHDAWERLIELEPNDHTKLADYSGFLRRHFFDLEAAEDYASRAMEVGNSSWARRQLAITLYLKWGELKYKSQDEAAASRVLAEARKYWPDPNIVLFGISWYPLVPAVTNGFAELGVDVSRYAGMDPLYESIRLDNFDVLRALVEAGAPLDRRTDPTGDTPIHWAIRADRPIVVSYLLEAGANPFRINKLGQDSLALASELGTAEIERILIDAMAHLPIGEESFEPNVPFEGEVRYRVVQDIESGDRGGPFRKGTEVTFYMFLVPEERPDSIWFLFQMQQGFTRYWKPSNEELENWGEWFERVGG